MKKITFAIALLFCAFAANSQTLDPDYSYTISDTITDSEADTILLPALMVSPWSYNWTVVTTQLSGTQAITAAVQESASKTGTDWFPVSSVSMSGSADIDRIVGALIYGYRQRLIITGTGTQSTTYTIRFVAKKVFK